MPVTLDDYWPDVVAHGVIVHRHKPSNECNNRCHVVSELSEIDR